MTVNGIHVTGYNQYSYIVFGSNLLLYQVLASNGVWNDDLYRGAGLAGSYKGTDNGDAKTLSIPYIITAGQYAPHGNYTNTVSANLIYVDLLL